MTDGTIARSLRVDPTGFDFSTILLGVLARILEYTFRYNYVVTAIYLFQLVQMHTGYIGGVNLSNFFFIYSKILTVK